jgi:hypothetical protein
MRNSKRFYAFPADDRTHHVIGWDVIDRETSSCITTFCIVRRVGSTNDGGTAERMARAEARRLNAGGTRKQGGAQ